MILPRPRNDTRRQRITALGGSLFLMVVLHAGLRGTPLPAFGSSRAVIRELNPLFVERYATPPPPEIDDAAPTEATEAPVNARLEQEVGTAIDELVRRFAPGGVAAEGRARSGTPSVGTTGIEADPEAERFTELFGTAGDAAAVTAPRARATTTRGQVRAGGIGIETRRTTPARRDGADLGDPDISVETARSRSEDQPATEVVIKEYEAGSLNLSEVEVLAEWIEANPADLPVGVKVHLNYSPAFLTASMPLVTGTRELELYLMFNAGLRELHIVLVEDDRSVYLIDRGFQEQSRSLREGTVQRLEGEIVTVDSRAGAASSDRAREFYNIFLSWWDTAKRDVRR